MFKSKSDRIIIQKHFENQFLRQPVILYSYIKYTKLLPIDLLLLLLLFYVIVTLVKCPVIIIQLWIFVQLNQTTL